MNLYQIHGKKRILQHIYQCFLGMITFTVILFLLDINNHAAILSTLGATTFIVFTLPRSYSSDLRRLLGGYGVGLLAGLFGHYLILFLYSKGIDVNETQHLLIGGFIVGFSLFFMTLLDAEHPPAAGLSIGLIFNPWKWSTIIVVIFSVLILALIKTLLKNWLVDLALSRKKSQT
jgi:CBS-domain-containing membrane protein